MFGDNESVVNSASIPHARLHKQHNALSFHKVREGVDLGLGTNSVPCLQLVYRHSVLRLQPFSTWIS